MFVIKLAIQETSLMLQADNLLPFCAPVHFVHCKKKKEVEHIFVE